MKTLMTSFMAHRTNQNSLMDRVFWRTAPIQWLDSAFGNLSTLLVTEKIIADDYIFEDLSEKPDWIFGKSSETLHILHSEGFVELVSYDKILNENRQLIEAMTTSDLTLLDNWIEPLEASLEVWISFMRRVREIAYERETIDEATQFKLAKFFGQLHSIAHATANHIGSMRIDLSEYRNMLEHKEDFRERVVDRIREQIRAYLFHVNASLVIAAELQCGFNDWSDLHPFYAKKLITVQQEQDSRQMAAKKLFDIAFPEFAINNAKTLVKILKDKRVNELRKLVDEAAMGIVDFDEAFARNVFKEVFKIEQSLSGYNRIVSYLTTPVGFIPGVGNFLSIAGNEAGNYALSRKLRQDYRWFYLLNDVVGINGK